MQRLLVKYGSQISVLSLVAAFAYLIVNPSKSSAVKGGKKRRWALELQSPLEKELLMFFHFKSKEEMISNGNEDALHFFLVL